jgi:hypothetical protein
MREREKSVNLLRPTEKLTAGKKLFSQSEEESKLIQFSSAKEKKRASEKRTKIYISRCIFRGKTYKSHAVHSQKNSKAARD